MEDNRSREVFGTKECPRDAIRICHRRKEWVSTADDSYEEAEEGEDMVQTKRK